ncbi:hypothetical protein P245_14360 [Comamonas thiooxydans]|uniref:DUF2514 family protein n=1 Tax=Comamonas thiooxydans TaxID=363952 RepID=A0A0E3BER8_9BURK|nr:hypothetical protein [Comamonas thiooxydans]KGG90950.1 hypothetical protein P245_14360 [Comamonas thiooxydans]
MARLTIYASLAAAAAGAALAWSFQAARLGAELADERLQASQYREQIADERTAAGRRVLAVERTVNATYQGALNDAIQKQAALQAAADRARRERDGLRQQLSDAEQRLADASPAALIEYARALGKVFGQCSQRYTELAIRADGHAADAATCRAAWPVIQPTTESKP